MLMSEGLPFMLFIVAEDGPPHAHGLNNLTTLTMERMPSPLLQQP